MVLLSDQTGEYIPYRSGLPPRTSRKGVLGKTAAQQRSRTCLVSTSKNCA
jgi:hypothetical protein